MNGISIRSQSKVMAVNEHDEILLLRRTASAFTRPLEWDLPGGHVESDEDLTAAASRELEEESGIRIASDGLHVVYALTELPSEERSVTWIFFLARVNTKEVSLSDEHDAFQWVPLEQAITLSSYDRQIRALKHVAEHDLPRAHFE